jgi:hypothetical protein
MPSPSTSLATLRPDLAGSLEEFDLAADRAGFIGQLVYPVLDVKLQAGTFGKIPVEQLLQDKDSTRRTSRSGYNRGNYTFTDASYATEEHGWEEPVDDREAKLYASYFDAEQMATVRAFDKVLRNQEKRVAAAVFNASTFAALTTGVTNEWDANHTADAKPIDDVEAAANAVWNQCGMWPNALVINRHVFRRLRHLAQIIDAIASSGAGSPTKARDITAQQLAAVFDLDYVFVAGGAKNTANEGQSAVFDKIWSDEYAMVCRVATTNDVREPCLGRVFHWAEDGSQIGGTVETYREEQIRGDVVRVRHDVDEVNIMIECGHLLSNVTTI